MLDYYEVVLEKQSWLAGKASILCLARRQMLTGAGLQSDRRVPHSVVSAAGDRARVCRGSVVAVLSEWLVGAGSATACGGESAPWLVSGDGELGGGRRCRVL